jgi:hypothetical protein
MATGVELLSQAQCTTCAGVTTFEAIEITLLRNILSSLGVDMTQQEINAEAACFACLGMSLAEASILVLLNNLTTTIAGGGSGAFSANLSGAGSPVGVVTPDAVNQFYRDTTGVALWQSTGLTNLSWVQWI